MPFTRNSNLSLAIRLIMSDEISRKYSIFSVIAALFCAAFTLLELLAIAVVASALAHLLTPGSTETNQLLTYAGSLGIFILPIIAVIYLLNFVAQAGLFFGVQRLGAAIAVSIFENRSRSSDVLVDQTNNGVLVNDIGMEVNRLTQQVIAPLAICISKLFIVVTLVGYSIYISPLLTFIAAVTLLSGYSFILFITRLRTHGLSAKVAELLQGRMSLLSNYVSGYKYFWISKNYDAPAKKLRNISNQYADVQANVGIISILPKTSIEMLIICLLGVFVFSPFITNEGQLPISIFDAAQLGAITLKLIPSLSSLFAGFINISSNMSAWDVFSRNGSQHGLTTYKRSAAEGTEFRPFQIEFPSGFGPENLTFLVPTIVLFTGASGSGKTTFFDGLVGLRDYPSMLRFLDPNSFFNQREISYVPQENFVFEGSIVENLFCSIDGEKDEMVRQVWDTCGLSNLTGGRYNPDFKVFPGRLSGGQKQRLAIARALIEEKRLLILDESFAGIDIDSAKEILVSIKENHNAVIFFASHDDQLKKMADVKVKVARV